jgi:hypothetical protein
MLAEAMLDIRGLKEVNAKKWGARRTKGEPSSMWFSWACARSGGRVKSSIWRPRVITIHLNILRIGSNVWNSELSPCRKNTRVGTIGLFIMCCVAKAGRLITSASSECVDWRAWACGRSINGNRASRRVWTLRCKPLIRAMSGRGISVDSTPKCTFRGV